MTEQAPQNHPKNKKELSTGELGTKVEGLIVSYKDVLRTTPEVSRVLISSFLGTEVFSGSFGDEGIKANNGIVFHRGNSAYELRAYTGLTDPMHPTAFDKSLHIIRYPLKDGKSEFFEQENLYMHVTRELVKMRNTDRSISYQEGDITHSKITFVDYNKQGKDGYTEGTKALKPAIALLQTLRDGI